MGADAYIKALISAPEVEKRITELENCLQRLANAVLALDDIDRRPKLRAVAEEAAMLLKNRLEVGDLTLRVKQNVRGRFERAQTLTFCPPRISSCKSNQMRMGITT